MDYAQTLKNYQSDINLALAGYVKDEALLQGKLFEAMGYSLHAGGKRLRPVLVLEFARMLNPDVDAMPFACAIEMIHTYSLIHDDLPCMDDDELRRGKPTNHMVYGEALALLAGDALLNKAFEVSSDAALKIDGNAGIRAVSLLSQASGAYGMIGGQVIDMEGEERSLTLEEITTLQSLKTGALIRASAGMGCVLGGATAEQYEASQRYAEALGLAFQIQDDILNVEGDPEIIGKDVGNDERSGKSTFVRLLGIDECKAKVKELTQRALDALSCFGNCDFLIWLTNELADRNY